MPDFPGPNDKLQPCEPKDNCENDQDRMFQGRKYNKNSHRYSNDGSIYLTDKEGNQYNSYGRYYDPDTKKLMDKKDGTMYYNSKNQRVDEDGGRLNDDGKRVNSKGQLVDKDNKLINEKGERIDASGNVINSDSPTNWARFAKTLLLFLLITLFVGIVGSSFIYLTSRGTHLDNILPTDEDYYRAKKINSTERGPVNIVGCEESSAGTNPIFEDNFPYNMVKNKPDNTPQDPKTMTLVDRFCNWGARMTGGVFKNCRALFKGWLNCFTPGTPMGNHVFQMYLAAPFTFFCSLLVPFFAGFQAFISAFAADPKIAVWGCFFMYTFGGCMGLSGIIFLRMIGTMVFLPMSQNWKEVANIMACNVKPMVVLFGFFVCGAAYDALDPVIAGVMGVVYMCLVGWTVFKYFSRTLF